MARPSLHRKLVIVVVAAVLAALAVSTAVTVSQQASMHGNMRKQALVATAQVFSAAIGPATAAHNMHEVLLALRAIGRVPDIRYAEVRSFDGRVLATLGGAARLAGDPSLQSGNEISLFDLLTSGTVQTTVPILNGGTVVGWLTLIGGVADLWPQLISTLAFTALGGGIALMVGLAVAWRFQRAITGPLQALVQAMMRIRKGHDYGVAVPDAADREIGELVDGFNRMLRDVRERDDRLEAHRRNLEQEVADRTCDLREARDAAETANRAKSEFLATMSHEIRTPMNGIMVMAELLTGGELPARQRRFAEIIAQSGQNLLAIINDILDFSKVEAGKIELESRPVDLNELAENVTGLFAERARTKGIDLAAVVDPSAPRSVAGDPVRLSQVISNLVNNALKFTERGFVKLAIAPAAGDANSIAISVRDSGIGIPQDKLATIFEAFSQADQSTTRQFGGTGLGLAICKRLVEAMGGEIRVESGPGKGSTFSVVVPAKHQEKREWPRLALSFGELRFCVLDTAGEATASALERYLAASGYTVLRRDDRLTIEQCAQASLICADADRLCTLAFPPDRARPIVIAVSRLGDASADELVRSGKADAVISRPVLRSEIESLLERIKHGEGALQPSASTGDKAEGILEFAPFRALVADDNPVNREVASEALSQLGASVATVENGLQAVEALASASYDIVFMDGSMPELDGFEATRRIRELEAAAKRPRTIIVALTAHVVGTAADAWRDAGMDDVVHKPFTIGKLARTIETLLPHLASSSAASNRAHVPAETSASPGQSPRQDDATPLLDADVVVQLRQLQAMGKGDFVHKVFHLYLEHAPPTLERVRQSAASGRLDECAKAAHALKSMSFNIGAKRVAELSLAIETAAKTQRTVPGRTVLEELSQTLDMTLQGLESSDGLGLNDREDASLVGSPAIARASTELERALPLALQRDELFLLYQPIVDRAGTRTCGVEALVRWNRDGGEPVSPGDFIPIAERTGMIHDLGDWVLRRACADAIAWPSLSLAVNVSPVQFARADLVERFERILSETQFDGRRLEIEITETSLLEAEHAVLQVMERLDARGVAFALDDFGTGYSSLNYLRRFPFGKIKIDRSFVANLNTAVDATIVHAIASIGRSLGLKLVAEGVEDAEQQRFLSAAGIHFMQGYRFGRPMPCEAISQRLQVEREGAAVGWAKARPVPMS
jgi:two-component system sensor histidine kinase BarA